MVLHALILAFYTYEVKSQVNIDCLLNQKGQVRRPFKSLMMTLFPPYYSDWVGYMDNTEILRPMNQIKNLFTKIIFWHLLYGYVFSPIQINRVQIWPITKAQNIRI